jgi:hypothetical protein
VARKSCQAQVLSGASPATRKSCPSALSLGAEAMTHSQRGQLKMTDGGPRSANIVVAQIGHALSGGGGRIAGAWSSAGMI